MARFSIRKCIQCRPDEVGLHFQVEDSEVTDRLRVVDSIARGHEVVAQWRVFDLVVGTGWEAEQEVGAGLRHVVLFREAEDRSPASEVKFTSWEQALLFLLAWLGRLEDARRSRR